MKTSTEGTSNFASRRATSRKSLGFLGSPL
jgi:hypothetical protein